MTPFRCAAAFLVLTFLFASQPSQATVYKCTIKGTTNYQDQPCPGDSPVAAPSDVTAPAATAGPASPAGTQAASAAPIKPQGRDEVPVPVEMPLQAASAAAAGISGEPVSSLSLPQLFSGIRTLTARHTELSDAYQKAIDEARRRLTGDQNRALRLQAPERLRVKWLPLLMAVDQRQEAIVAELRRRCPDGVNMRENSTTCQS